MKPQEGVLKFIEDNMRLEYNKPIKLYPYQKEIILCDSQFRLILKARQVGISTVIAMESLAYALLFKGQTILIVSASERQAQEILNYVKNLLFNMPDEIRNKIALLEETKSSLRFSNGSRILSLPNNPNTVQGFRANRIYIDEFAHFINDKAMTQALIPSISHGGCVTIVSTPAGKRGEFYRLYTEAMMGRNDFKVFTIPYTKCPSEVYRKSVESIKSSMDAPEFRLAYCCEFVDEKESYFPFNIILPCVDDRLNMVPSKDMRLTFGIDFGKQLSSTVVIVVENKKDLKVVRYIKEFRNTPYSIQLRWISNRILTWNPEKVFIDATGIGIRLHEEMRESFGSRIVPVKLYNPERQRILSNLRILFEDKKIIIPKNERLISQLHSIRRVPSGPYVKFVHDKHKHDDYVWALALACSEEKPPQLRYMAVGSERPAIDFSTSFFEEEEEM